jgi:hypothetical protein
MASVEPKLDLAIDVQAYAALSARLAEPDADRDALLAEHGLDEDGWDELDDAWQARLSEDADATGEQDAVPPLVKEHAEAFARAQAERVSAGEPLSFERFIQITHDIQRAGSDVKYVLQKNGTTLHEYLRAEQHWLRRMMDDAALQARFHKAMDHR